VLFLLLLLFEHLVFIVFIVLGFVLHPMEFLHLGEVISLLLPHMVQYLLDSLGNDDLKVLLDHLVGGRTRLVLHDLLQLSIALHEHVHDGFSITHDLGLHVGSSKHVLQSLRLLLLQRDEFFLSLI
jgi:hypothetical protein